MARINKNALKKKDSLENPDALRPLVSKLENEREMKVRKFLFLTITVMLIALFFFLFSLWRYKKKRETVERGEIVEVLVQKVECDVARNRNFIVFNNGSHNHIVNVRKDQCAALYVGKKIRLLYNKDVEWYFVPEVNYNEEMYGMIGGLSIMLLSLIALYRSRKGGDIE